MKAYFVCLVVFTLFHCREVIAEPTVVTSIQGAIRVGFSEYGAYPFINSINVSCRASLPVAGRIELFENSSSVDGIYSRANVSIRPTVTFPRTIGSHERIIFTCRFQSMNAGYTSYIVDDSVGFTLWSEKPPQPQCISPFGSSVTTRESLNLTCVAPLTDSLQRLTWNGLDAPSADLRKIGSFAIISEYVNVSDILNPLVCSMLYKNGSTTNICRLSFEIISEPAVTISPSSFSDVMSGHSFSCTSNPPAIIQWTVYGDDGDILNDLLIINLNVSINQNVAGTSTINLTGKAVPSLNIHTVLCIAYEKSFIRVGVAQREIPKSSRPTTSTIDSSTTQLDDNGGVDNEISGSDNSTAFIIVITISVVINFVLTIICVYVYLRSRVTDTAKSDTNHQQDSVQQDNVAYEPYVSPASAPPQYIDIQ